MDNETDAEMDKLPEGRVALAAAHAANMAVIGLAHALIRSKAIDSKSAALGVLLMTEMVGNDAVGRAAKLFMRKHAKLIAELDGDGTWTGMLATSLETVMTPPEKRAALEAWREQATDEERSADIYQALERGGFVEPKPAAPSGRKAVSKKAPGAAKAAAAKRPRRKP